MKRALLLTMLGVAGLPAQTAQPFLSLTGPWTKIQAGAPDSQLPLPLGRIPEPLGRYRLERSVDLPQTADMALLLPPLLGPYTVSVNGREIGRFGEMDSIFVRNPAYRDFTIPDGVLRARTNRISIDIANSTRIGALHFLGDAGPWLGAREPLHEIALGRNRTEELRAIHVPITVAIDLLLSVILLFLIRDSRIRPVLLWILAYLMMAVVFGVALTLDAFTGFPPTIVFDWIVIGTVSFTPVFAIESLLFLLQLKVPVWLRVTYYLAMLLIAAFLGIASPFRGVYPLVLAAFAVLALRRKNKTALVFAMLLLGYELIPIAPFGAPHYAHLGLVQFNLVPLYRNAVTVLLILTVIRQSTADRAERERLASEMAAARVIQSLLLRTPVLREASLEAVYLPALEVGGDFYYVIDGQLLVIGDVSGKGLKAAMLVSLIVGVLRGTHERRPAAILAGLNRALAGQIDSGFVTCCCALFQADGTVAIANAGHPPPYCDGREVALKAGLPLGIAPDAEYSESVAQGGAFTFVSDGVTEAANPKGELFGFERTAKASLQPARPIAEAARAWGQNDDITVVTVRRTGV